MGGSFSGINSPSASSGSRVNGQSNSDYAEYENLGRSESAALDNFDVVLNKNNESFDYLNQLSSLLKPGWDKIMDANIDVVTAAYIVNDLFALTDQKSMNAQKNTLIQLDKKRMALAKNQLEKIRQNCIDAAKQRKEMNKQKDAQNTNLGFSVLAFLIGLAAVIGTIATGGAGLALFVAAFGAVAGAMSMSCDIANRALANKTGEDRFETDPYGNKRLKDASIGRLFRYIAEAIDVQSLKDSGKDPQKLSKEEKEAKAKKMEDFEKGVNVAVTVAIVVVALVGAAASIAPIARAAMKATIENVIKSMPEIFGRGTGRMIAEQLIGGGAKATKESVTSMKNLLLSGAKVSEALASSANSVTDLAIAIIGIQLSQIKFDLKTVDNQLKLNQAAKEICDRHMNDAQELFRRFADKFESDISSGAQLISSTQEVFRRMIKMG